MPIWSPTSPGGGSVWNCWITPRISIKTNTKESSERMNTSRGTFCESQKEEGKNKSGGSGGIPKISHMRMHFSFFISLVPITIRIFAFSLCCKLQHSYIWINCKKNTQIEDAFRCWSIALYSLPHQWNPSIHHSSSAIVCLSCVICSLSCERRLWFRSEKDAEKSITSSCGAPSTSFSIALQMECQRKRRILLVVQSRGKEAEHGGKD